MRSTTREWVDKAEADPPKNQPPAHAGLPFLEEWSHWARSVENRDSPPYIFEPDRPVIMGLKETDRPVMDSHGYYSHRKFGHPEFGGSRDRRLHLGLLPHPFCGDMRKATIYVLMLNPGVGYQDYFGEYKMQDFRQALLRNLDQDFTDGRMPFLFLDPRFAWHGGFRWWHRKLAGVIERLAGTPERFAEARERLARRLASIELIPYHSPSFNNPGGLTKKLRSAQLAADFVNRFVLPRVREGKAIAIVARKTRIWCEPFERDLANLTKAGTFIVYDRNEARGAHLGPKTRGGKAILHHLATGF